MLLKFIKAGISSKGHDVMKGFNNNQSFFYLKPNTQFVIYIRTVTVSWSVFF